MLWCKEIEEYLDDICKHVKYKKDRQDIRDEIGAHIDELIWDLKSDGVSEEEAVSRAIEYMGDAEYIGISLNKVHNPIVGWMFVITNIAVKVSIAILIMFFSILLILEFQPSGLIKDKNDIVYEEKLNFKGKIDDTAVKLKKITLLKDGYVYIEFLQYPTRLSAIHNNSIVLSFDIYLDDVEKVETKAIGQRKGLIYTSSDLVFNANEAEKIVLDYDKYNRKMRVEIPLKGNEHE